MEIKSLYGINPETISKGFSEAFADYDIQISKEQFQKMLRRRGFNSKLSFAAFEGDRIIAFTLNGVGYFYDKPTAYDTGTGTVKEYRGQKLASAIFEYSIPFLKAEGIQQYLLEVLQHNAKAISVYQQLGFQVSREFNYYMQPVCDIQPNITHKKASFDIQQIDINTYPYLSSFWDFCPSWQNSPDSIQRANSGFVYLGAFGNNELIGYAVFEPLSGDIAQLAVKPEERRKGAASLLLSKIIELNLSNILKILNIDTTCHSLSAFLEASSIKEGGKQYEMIKHL